MKRIVRFYGLALLVTLAGQVSFSTASARQGESHWKDDHFIQDFSIKYSYEDVQRPLKKVVTDRNGKIQVLSSAGLLHPHAGAFLYPGDLAVDGTYRFLAEKAIVDLQVYREQLVYLDDEAVLSNAWAGELFSRHQMSGARMFAGGEDFDFLLAGEGELSYLKDSNRLWRSKISGPVLDLKYAPGTNRFWILTPVSLHTFSPETEELKLVFEGADFTAFDVVASGTRTIIGTSNGYIEFNNLSNKAGGEIHRKLPVTEIRTVAEVNGQIWFGTPEGAFSLRRDGGYHYYYGKRWLPDNRVVDIAAGPEGSVLVLTEKGLGQIVFTEMTLAEKADYFEKQVRLRHLRNGFNATLSGMSDGNLSTGYLADSDNDGLWTSMYLAGEVFRYSVTGSDEALQHVRESLDAMERLYTINPVPGFPSRSFERSGYIDVLSDPERWQHASDPEWDWKATTSSDEAIGHVFVFGVIAELIPDEAIRGKAIRLLDELMQHIVDNDWYLIDYDGEPTTWGRWNPEYVNGFATMVGDRKLNSSNIVAMLQTAYYFTGKEIYKEKANYLMENHGYLENLMRPMEEIGRAEEGSDEWAAMLSESWNHSDDEMYFLGYWGLYRYAFTDELRDKYKLAIVDHWEAERPEKDGLWNIFTAMVSPDNFDLEEAIWYLQEYPLDLIHWTMKNSHRKDIVLLEENFRRQSTAEVLPPDELPIRRHNANRFDLDGGRDGNQESSAGDIWLLPYWMGRYLQVIR
ncbi:hypothetical protein SAMN05192553_10399 [Cyclobacterium xiamenense]|uniref:Two component regulator propeller n=1 Tax=Cyclobacterium xiamenense TaxID=1297121 RepID=A0A1H6XQ31_9BACT|nr:hypothetical protein [Cyclobacterium xiamenense]SEJ29694.1 hypothetical protein SAMN05192553_10399 [Cyclobacterium xiamenense]